MIFMIFKLLLGKEILSQFRDHNHKRAALSVTKVKNNKGILSQIKRDPNPLKGYSCSFCGTCALMDHGANPATANPAHHMPGR
jgi:hypothetical protein